MDLDFSDEQQQLRKTARDFLSKECPTTVVRELEASDLGFSTAMWQAMGKLGWLGITAPEEYGGSGGNFVDLAIFHEELGRALCPIPHIASVVLCGGAIRAGGSASLKRDLLPQVVSGKKVGAFAIAEAAGTWQASGIKARATKNGKGYVLRGTKLFVQWGQAADFFVVAARTGAQKDGIGLFVVGAGDAGVKVTPLATMAGEKQAEVALKDVAVPEGHRLGPAAGAWPIAERVTLEGLLALSAQMAGGAQRILEIATEYAKNRVQFGRPIGSFQSLQHYLADVDTEVTALGTLVYQAAWALDQGLPSRREIAILKAFAGETYRHATMVANQIHGGIGFIMDTDVQLFYRRAKQMGLSMYTREECEELVARELGL